MATNCEHSASGQFNVVPENYRISSAKHRPDLLGLRLREEGLCAIFLGLRLREEGLVPSF